MKPVAVVKGQKLQVSADGSLSLMLYVRFVCVVCGDLLTSEEEKDFPQFAVDPLCHHCLEWLGRNLVRRLGQDPHVAHIGDAPEPCPIKDPVFTPVDGDFLWEDEDA